MLLTLVDFITIIASLMCAFAGNFIMAAQGPALEFIELHTVRSARTLFEYRSRGARLRDDGMRGQDRALTVEEPNGRATTYVIDGPRSLITKIEIIAGQAPDMLGRPMPIVQSYEFSNFRTVQGVPTPFKVEHFTNGIKVEEMSFTSVRYNTGLQDGAFHP